MVLKEYLKTSILLLFLMIIFFILGKYYNFTFFYFISFLFLILNIFSLYFFRNPNRVISYNENEILSPSDGRILEILEEYNELLEEKVFVVRIFLSIFDVHVQRAPISGIIKTIFYKKGKFFPAMNKLAHLENEQNTVLFENKDKKVLCKQIAGLIARTIVFWNKENDLVSAGDLFGMIKFGSQVDIYFPIKTRIKITKGEKVVAGKTVIAIWN